MSPVRSGGLVGGIPIGLITPGYGGAPPPLPWDPPRDIKINLFPIRQNLITNPVGLGGNVGWAVQNGTVAPIAPGDSPINWPSETISGLLGSGFLVTFTGGSGWMIYSASPVNPGDDLSFSLYAMPSAGTATYQIGVQFLDVHSLPLGNPTYGTATSTLDPSGNPQFVRGGVGSLIAPANTYLAQAQLLVETPATPPVTSHYFTGALLEPHSSIGPYFDANFSPAADYLFEGIPNRSVSDYYPNLQTKVARLKTVMPDYVPIGATFSIVYGAQAFANVRQQG